MSNGWIFLLIGERRPFHPNIFPTANDSFIDIRKDLENIAKEIKNVNKTKKSRSKIVAQKVLVKVNFLGVVELGTYGRILYITSAAQPSSFWWTARME